MHDSTRRALALTGLGVAAFLAGRALARRRSAYSCRSVEGAARNNQGVGS